MAEATTVGSTKVTTLPDLTRFGPELRSGLVPLADRVGREVGDRISEAIGRRLAFSLPSSMRDAGRAMEPAARRAGSDAGDQFADGFQTKLTARLSRMRPSVTVQVKLDDAAAKAGLNELAKKRTVDLSVSLDDAAARAGLGRLAASRQVTVTADLDDKQARAKLAALTKPCTVTVTADLDDRAAKTRLAALTKKSTATVDVRLVQGTIQKVESRIARLGQAKTVEIVPKIRESAYKMVERRLAKLAADRMLTIYCDVDTRVAAESLRVLTRRRRAIVQADAQTTAAATALNYLARDRTATVRVRTIQLPGLGGGADGGAGVAGLAGRLPLLAGAALAALPTIAALGQAIAQLGPAAALAAPAVSLLGASFAAIKIGTAGIGEAFKAAFNPVKSDATVAASATKQVETAQRQLAQAQRGVQDAERNLTAAQRDARAAQAELNAARREAIRSLEDMNAAVKRGAVDQRQAALDVQQAEEDLARTRSDPTATQLEMQQAQARLDAAKLSAEEQSRQYQRLKQDAAAANKAGVEGSDQVTAARDRIRQADEQVTQQERAVQDAHQAVADAATAVAEAQQAAATQTSKLDTAMAKLAPNARSFVNEVRAMAPAWRGLKLNVQDALFAGLGQRLTAISRQIIPTLTAGLAGTAAQLNIMAKGAMNAVSNLEKAGTLGKVFDGVRSSLSNLNRIPGQIVTGLAQLSVAAQPAMNRLTTGIGSAMDQIMAKLSAGIKSGALTEAINNALNVAVSFGHVIADVFGVVKNVMGAAAAAGGDFFGVFGAAVKELRRITAMPEVQAALKSIFTALQAVASLFATVLGAALRAVLPLLAALAPTITALAKTAGPVLTQLAQALGQALMPIIKALAPVISMVGQGILDLVSALTPLLVPIGKLIGAIIKALAPVLTTIIDVIVKVVGALAGPLGTIINALVPVVQFIGQLISQVFKALTPIIGPLVAVVGALAQGLASILASVIKALLPALQPLIPVIVLMAEIFAQMLVAILRPLTPVITQLATVIAQILVVAIKALAPIIKIVADVFRQLLPSLRPLIPQIAQLVMAVLQLIPPLLTLTLVILKPLLTIIALLAGLLVRALGAALLFLVPIVVRVLGWIIQLATIVTKIVHAIVNAFKWLFDKLLGHSIIPDIVNGIVNWFTGLWHRAVNIFNSIKDGIARIWNSLWSGIKSVASSAYSAVRKGFDKFADGFKGAFRKVRDAIGDIWDKLKGLVKSPVKFWIDVVYNKGIRTVWNNTAGKIPGVPNLDKMTLPKGFARGGIISGWSPGRDIHRFYSPTGGMLDLSGGESVMRPEWTAAVGPAAVDRMNALARGGKTAAIRRIVSGVPGFDIGGIIGDVGSSIAGGVGKVLGKGADLVRGGIADLASAAFKPVRDGIRSELGSDKGTWPGMIAAAPINLIDRAIDYIRGKEQESVGAQWIKPVNVPYGTKFGVKGSRWASGYHTGLDFPAKVGTPVKAVAVGRVTSAVGAGPYGPYGKNIAISHGGGLSSFYAHLSQILVAPRGTVAAGAGIGRVGATGNVTGPHLHLEARLNGKPVDPMPYLEGDDGSGVGGTGVQRWRSTVVQALREVGQSVSLVNTTLRRMDQESGGNPKAVNRYDSNWRAGHPSVGLMQVIKPTFRAHAGKYLHTGPFLYGVSINPMANIFASMRYALAAYGSLSRAYNRPGGYAVGGTARPGELAWVGERGPELMRVFSGGVRIYPHEQSKQMARTMGAPIPGFAAGGVVDTARAVRSMSAAASTATVDSARVSAAPLAGAVVLPRNHPLRLVLADGSQMDAYIDTRVDGALDEVYHNVKRG